MKADKPSGTARLIAKSAIYLNANPTTSALIPPGAVEYSRRFLGADDTSRFERLCRKPWFQKLLLRCEGWTVPGLPIHFALRKRYIEQVVRESIGSGYKQVVVLGAGFDTLALRLRGEYPDCRFIEVDHPATQQAKLSALSEADLETSNLKFVASDFSLSGEIERVLNHESVISSDVDTVFVAEGLFMYLSEEEVTETLRSARRGANAETRIVFTFMQPGKESPAAFEKQSLLVYLWLRHEPFRWGVRIDAMPEFLRKAGLYAERVMTPGDLRDRAADLVPASYRPNGDLVCVADYSSSDRG